MSSICGHHQTLKGLILCRYELGSDTIPTTKKLKYGYAPFSQKNDENENEAEGRPGHVHIVVNWGDSVKNARGISYPPFVLTCNPLMKEEEFYHMVLTSLQSVGCFMIH